MVIILWLIIKIPMEYVCDCNFPLSLYYLIFQHKNKVKTVKPYEQNNHEWKMQYICFFLILLVQGAFRETQIKITINIQIF